MINVNCDIKVSGVALSRWVRKNIDTTAENFKNYLIKDCKLSSKEQLEAFYETFIAAAKELSLMWTFMQSKIYRNADGKLINLGSSKKAFIDFMTLETSGGLTNPSEDPLFKIEGMWQAYNKNKDMDTEVLSIYGIATQIDGLRRKQFKQDVVNRIILRKDLSGHINVVTDIYSLQRSILDYKQSLFKLLVDYINEYNGSSLSSILYETSAKIIDDDAFIEAMNEAKKLFKTVDVNKAYSEQDNKVINAVSAYLNLKYFDEMLEEEVDMLTAAPELKGKEIGYKFRGSKPIIKYRILSDSKGKVVGWNTSEYRDGLKESSPLVKTLLEAVEIVDENGLPLGSNLDAAKVVAAWTSLLYQLRKVSETNEDLGGLINLLDNINDNPTQTILNLFNGIFRSKRGLESTKAAIQNIINKSSINKNIERNFQFTVYDLNVLRTFYNTFIDPQQLNILFAETRQIRNGEIPLSSLLISELMPSLLIRVNTINYWETIYNDDKYVSRVHPRWESTRDSKTYKDLQNSNFALLSPMITENLMKTYNIERKNVKSVNIKIGGVNYTLSLDTPLHTNRLTGYDKSITMSDGYGKDLIKSACSQLFDGNKFTSGKIFDLLQYFDGKSDTMKDAGDLLKFIDDMLNLGLTTERGLNILETLITLNRNRDNKNGDNSAITIIKQLVSSAAKVALLLAIRLEYNDYLLKAKTNDEEPKTLLNFIQDGFGFNNASESELKKSILYSFNGFEGFKVIGDRTWVDEWWNATAQMMGTNVKSTTKNQQGNNVANTRPSSLNGLFREKLHNFNENGGAKMLFTGDSSAVIGLTPASDLLSKYGIKKEVKSANVKELMYDSFVNNFLNNIMLNNVIAIQPTVYSDKTTIALALIDLTKQIQYGKLQKLLGDISDSEILDLWFSSVGNFFKQLHDKVMSDLRKILGLGENATIYDINDILKTKTYEELNQLRKNYNITHPNDKINIVEDLHYRRVNGKLALNELVVYYNELYSNRKNFNARVKKEQIKFAQDFLDYGVKIYYDGILSSFIGSNHGKKIIESIMNTDDVSEFKEQWFQNNKLIIAKTKDGKIIQSGEIVPDDAIINPLLLRYFNLDNLISANIKYPLLGAETSHPNKASVNLKNIASLFTPGIFTPSEISEYSTDLVSLKKGISETKGNKQKELKRIWDKLVYETISAAEGTLYKRNVIMPATFLTRLTNSLRGNSKMVKVATIRDTHGTMFTINGNQKTDQEVNDGAARVTPEEVILMNGALGDLAVSYDIVKSIGYHYDTRTGTMSELKFAAHTLSNAMMHISNGSEYLLFNLYKQNTNMKWDLSIQDSDITNNKLNCVNTKINFNIDITTGKAFKDGKLMYEDSNGKFEIVDMIKNGNIYYTIELDSNFLQLLVAQLFINDVPMKIRLLPEQSDKEFIALVEAMYNSNENITTIDSTYKLWEAMGGMYSGHYDDNAQFVFDESSHYAVANYMNNYNIAIKENPYNIQTQEYYNLPLKDTFISYNVNTSAMKCGQTNVNDEECWKGMKEMDWMEFDSTVFGPQMDSDHVADEAEMSEFTLVMSSVDAGGKMHWLAKFIFLDLGNIANTIMAEDVLALQEYIEANIDENVSEERKRIIKSKLYHIIGSEFIKNGSIRDDGLGRAIIEKVNTEFGIRNNNHFNDAHKIPFSDSNIYSQVISSYVTRVNKAIKRKYSGIGDVITPGYNVAQIYEINGIPYLFSDLYREAISKGYVADDTAISYRQKLLNIVNQYLDALLREQPVYTTRDWIEPTQIVDVLDSEGNWIATYDLDNVNDYYEFYTGKKPELQEEGLQYRVNIKRPKNLRPLRVAFKYRYNGQEYYGNLFQLKEVYEAFTTGTKTKNIDKLLYRLTHEYKTNIYDLNGILLNDVEIIPESIINDAAELLASNTYKTKMGLGDRSLNDILVNGLNTPEVKPININDSQIIMIDNKGNHTLITFNQPIESNYIKEQGFNDIKVEYDEYGNLSKHANVNGFFMEIGRGVLQKNMHIDKNRRITYKGKIIDSDEYFIFDDKVFKSVDFVKHYSKSQYSDGKVNKYNLYYLDEAALRELFGEKFKEDDIYIKLSNIIGRIFSGGHHSHIQLNTNITETENIKKIFDKLRNSYTINKIQRHIINETFNFLNKPKYNPKKNVWDNGYQEMLKKCLEDIKKIREVQFEASRYYTVARIPAQSLQSYMLMKLMGYINTDSNVAIVSHWQTELQGSDYDIDKVYMMGFEFDENGNFLEWSPLFDNSTKETFLASMLIPTPKGKVIQTVNPGEAYDVDIRNEVEQLNNTNDLVRRIQLKIQILSKIDSIESTNVKVLGGDKFLIAELNKHEEHSIDENYREEIFKNSVSGKLQAIVQAIENIPLAYSSINMSDLRRISNNTPEGINSASITGMNPMTKFIMQYQNMIGKSVIGIAAVGEKIFMGLSYYYNELVREPNVEKLKKNLDYLTFELKFDRIQGRWIPGVDGILLFFGQPVSVTKRSLTDVNLYAISNINEIREGLFRVNEILERLILLFEYINKDNPKLEKLLKTYKDKQLQLDVELELIKSGASNIQADLIISLLLSAATDNAKELILKRINSGPDTAGIYLNLIMLGFSINDICAFMNSPALQVVVQRTQVNMFDPYNNEFIPLYQMPICADEAKGKIVTRVYKLDSSTRQKLQDFAVSITENDNDSYSFVSEYSLKYRLDLQRGDKDKAYLDDCIQAIVLSLVRDKISKDELLKLVNGNSLVQVLVDEIIYLASLIKKAVLDIQTYSQYQDFDIALKNYLADIDEFKHVSSIQRETTLLGTTLLGINKGISTSQLDLVKRIADIENFWDKQESKYETVEDIIKAKPWYAGREKEIEDIIDRAKKAGVTNRRKRGKEKLVRFSFTDYLINLNGYRQAAIDYYNLIKDEWNIFDIMERSPLYKAALKAFEIAWLIPTVTITKNKIFSVIRQEIKSQSDVTYLDKFLQLQLELYAEKLLVSNWIEKANIYFPISKGLTIINRKFAKESSSDNMLINLSTPNNRMTFKYWIEEILLPSLMLNNEYTWTDEQGQSHTITVSSRNQFLKNLLRGFDGDKATYKLNMRINEIFLSNVASRRFHEIMNGLWELTKLKIGDYSIADYLGLYSICVSQNHYGNDRLTAAFREIARMLKDSLVAKYLDSIGELDIQGSQFTSQQLREYLRAIGFDVNDALMAIAKVYNSAADNKNQGKYVREPGGFTYLKWTGSSYSTDRVPSVFPKELTTASLAERMEASNNLLRYGLLYCPVKDNRNNILGFFDSDQALDILDGLIQASTLGYITIKHNC